MRCSHLISGHRSGAPAVLCAFDAAGAIETRKSTLKSLLRGKHAGIAFNAHSIADGALVYWQACALGLRGHRIEATGISLRSGRADCWLKVKNPAAPAVTREREEEWN